MPGKWVLGSEITVMRMILNAIPTKSYQAVVAGDTASEFCPELLEGEIICGICQPSPTQSVLLSTSIRCQDRPKPRGQERCTVAKQVRERSLWEPDGCGLVNFVDFLFCLFRFLEVGEHAARKC